jgi:hypothetical protein
LSKVQLRDAWEIGRHDLESVAIQDDDEPIIPDEVKNPPINELLQLKQEDKKQRHRHPPRSK